MIKLLDSINRGKLRITRDSITAIGFPTLLVFLGFLTVLFAV